MNIINGKSKVFFGSFKGTNERIYLSKPSWSCGWYWSFGYLGNDDCHYHLSNVSEGHNLNMYDALMQDYDLAPAIQDNLWQFCELVKTIYTLKEVADIYHRGGSNFTVNPCKELLQDVAKCAEINEVILPALFNAIAAITG